MRSEPNSNLRLYLRILRRRRWIALLAFLIPVAIAVVYVVAATKTYSGSASVVVNRRTLADEVTNSPDPTASASDFLSVVQTFADTARSTQVANHVVSAVPGARLTGKTLLSNSTVTPSQNSDVLVFTVEDRDPALASRLATAYATSLVTYLEQQNTSAINLALGQIDARLGQARKNRNQALIASLVSRDQQLRTLSALQIANNFVINPTTSASVASPKTTTDVALGVLGGILLAALLAALLETLDTRVRTSEEVESALGLPLLARIGPPPKGSDQPLALTAPADDRVEAFRILRTNLELQTLGKDIKVLMVSSSIEYEGKSVTIANLAVTAARAGRRAILVDLDLREPTQGALFGAGGDVPGVSDVLLGRVSLQDALIDVPMPGTDADGESDRDGSLRLLRSGTLPPDPGELVASSQLQHLIDQLRSEADVIYVDTPPMLRVGDAIAISRLCDAAFLVARIPDVRRPMLSELARVLSSCPVPVAGFAATGQKSGEMTYEYGYGTGRRVRGSAPKREPPTSRESDEQRDGVVAVAGGGAGREATGATRPAFGPDRAPLTEFVRSRRTKRSR